MFRLFAACMIAFAAVGLVQPSLAQDSQQTESPLPPLSPEHLELARQVFIASKTGRAFDEILPTVADRAKTTFIQSNPQMQLGIIEVVDRVALNLVKERKELDEGLIRVWARAFEPDDLQVMLEFYQSKAGQAFVEQYPKLISTQLAVGDNWTQSIGNKLANQVRVELQKMVNQDVKDLRGSETQGQ